jgi:hypothetical protein
MAAIAIRALDARSVSALPSRIGFALVMVVTFVLYTTGLDRNGWANTSYPGAVQAGISIYRHHSRRRDDLRPQEARDLNAVTARV